MSDYDDLQLLADRQGLPLAVAAYHFLRGGGSLSLTESMALSAASASALSAAGLRLQVEQAVRIGRAADGPKGRAAVQGEVDGGESARTQAVSDLIDTIESALHGNA